MKTAATYARFSTEFQSERSIDDQLTLCREFARREGLAIVAEFDDRARSGGSTRGRDGLTAMLEAAKAGQFKVLVIEALDRLSRDMEDLAGIHKRLTFHGVEIRAVHEGQINTILVGLRGLIGQLYREDNAHKIRRGQAGRSRDGLYAGGITYGYAAKQGRPGERTIVDVEAEVVRRIFAEFAAGASPRAIAAGLNADRIPSPRGGKWNASTINGSRTRGTGILQNSIYGGRQVWNRSRFIRDPDTGRRLSRPNETAERVTAERPDLAIVPAELYLAATERRNGRAAVRPEQLRKPKRILSGLLRCGACGAGMSSSGTDSTGRPRVRCSGAKERRDCPEPSTFYLGAIESAVVEGLRAELRDPRAIAEYVKAYAEEAARLGAGALAERDALEHRLKAVGVESERIIDWMLKGTGNIERLSARAKELEREENVLRTRLARAAPSPNVIALHPGLLAEYEAQLSTLAATLDRSLADGDTTAARAIRDLVETVIVRREGTTTDIELSGRLAALLSVDAFPDGLRRLTVGNVGSGGVNHAPPLTFRVFARAA